MGRGRDRWISECENSLLRAYTLRQSYIVSHVAAHKFIEMVLFQLLGLIRNKPKLPAKFS